MTHRCASIIGDIIADVEVLILIRCNHGTASDSVGTGRYGFDLNGCGNSFCGYSTQLIQVVHLAQGE